MEEMRLKWVNADWHERNPEDRNDYRNGFSFKNWVTDLGMIEKLKIPRTRSQGKAFSKTIRRAYDKNKDGVHRLLREMFLAGASTERTGEMAHILLGRKYSATYVSSATKKLDMAVGQYHRRPLTDHFRYLFFDGIVLKGKSIHGAKRRFVLACHGIDSEGKRELIDFMVEESESEASWTKFINHLHQRGLTGENVKLIITDGCAGLHAALDFVWPRVPRQRCWVHKLRNIADQITKRKAHMETCLFEAKLIYMASSKQEAKGRFLTWQKKWQSLEPKAVNCLKKDFYQMLGFFDSPKQHWRRIRTTNVIERVFREVRRRIRPMNCFKNDASCERILYAIFFYMNHRWENKKIKDWKSNPKFTKHPIQLLAA